MMKIGFVNLNYWKSFSCGFFSWFFTESLIDMGGGVAVGGNVASSFVMLTCLFSMMVLSMGYNDKEWLNMGLPFKNWKLYVGIGMLLIGAFKSYDNLSGFFVCFEAVLFPMFLLVLGWGKSTRKVNASYKLLFFTLFGSVFFFYSLIEVYSSFGTFELEVLSLNLPSLNYECQQLFWWCSCVAFMVKVPSLPFHTWLPEAHVEAPTAGSVVLASLLLKLGTFGYLMYNVFLMPEVTLLNNTVLLSLAGSGLVYASISTLRQVDMKRIIAYSSIAHMNVISIALSGVSCLSVIGAISMSFSHSFVSAGLFLLVGCLYERYHTRLVSYYSGLSQVMPLFCISFFLFSISNFSFPFSGNFSGEIILLVGLSKGVSMGMSWSGLVIGCTGLTSCYSSWLYTRVCFGVLPKCNTGQTYVDLTRSEFSWLSFCLVWNVYIGLYPQGLIQWIEPCVYYYLH